MKRFANLVETKLWYALLAIPILIIFGKVLTIPIASFQYEITLSEIVIAACSILCIGYLLSPQYRSKWHATPVGHALVLLFLLNLVSVLWVESIEKWIIALRVLTYQYATFFLLANLIKTKKQAIIAMSALLIPAIASCIYVAHAVTGIPFTDLLKLNRALLQTPLGALSFVAALVAMFVPITLYLFYSSKKLAYRIITSVVYIALIVGLLYGAGKAAILSAACGVLCMLILVRMRRIAVIGLTVCAVVIFVGLISVRQEGGAVVVNRFENINADLSTQFRVLELNAARQIFLDSPFIGQGGGNLKVAYKAYTGFYDGEANNIIVQYLAEFGLVGFVLFGYAVYQLLHLYITEYYHHRRAEPLMFGLFSAFIITTAINASFEVTIMGLIYGILFWYMIGIFAAYARART